VTTGIQVSFLADGQRLHLQNGPIDLVIGAFGYEAGVKKAYDQAIDAFRNLLSDLVVELPFLMLKIGKTPPKVQGTVAKRMVDAVWPFRDEFVTPMAAVAGAVADEMLGMMVADCNLDRAYVNNGGDIALYLSPGCSLKIGVVGKIDNPVLNGKIRITHALPVRGIATSGYGGRSHTLGIAEAVTVLAWNAAAADAAATILANSVSADDIAIKHKPANELDDFTDLGAQLVTTAVGEIGVQTIEKALDRGTARAKAMISGGLIQSAAILLKNQTRLIGESLKPIE